MRMGVELGNEKKAKRCLNTTRIRRIGIVKSLKEQAVAEREQQQGEKEGEQQRAQQLGQSLEQHGKARRKEQLAHCRAIKVAPCPTLPRGPQPSSWLGQWQQLFR